MASIITLTTDRSISEALLVCADMCAKVDEIMDGVHKNCM